MYLIGELAKRCNVTSDTLRFYEKSGLLIPAGRSSSGYRLYNDNNLAQINFILKAKQLGLTLDEIQELLEIQSDSNRYSCAEVKAITQSKLNEIDKKIAQLTEIRVTLRHINDACSGHVDSNASYCSILSALTRVEESKV